MKRAMKKQDLALLATLALSACGTIPQRQPQVRATPVPVIESNGAQTTRAKPQAVPRAQSSGGGYLSGDGPGADVPVDLDATPDAQPRVEPLHRYANRPYVALGQTYTPLTAPGNYKERGIASWYGKKFHGQRTSSGETYNMFAMSAAHPTQPIPSYVRVTNLGNNKSVVLRINDRGPFLHDRIIDLSYTAAHKLGIIGSGSAEVQVESLVPDAKPAAPITLDAVKSEALPLEPVTQTAPEPAPLSAPAAPAAVSTQAVSAGNAYLQLGAFKSQQSAESFLARMRAELATGGKEVVLYQKGDLVRVHLGPYSSAEEAKAIAEKLEGQLGFKPLVNLH